MAWATKYQINSKSVLRERWRLDIQEEDYAGSVTELAGAAEPFSLQYINNGDTFPIPIAASELTIRFVSDTFELEEIVDSDDKKFRVDLYREDVLQWRGFLSTDDCSEEYTSGNRTFEVIANDGLGFLKEEQVVEGVTTTYDKIDLLTVIRDLLYQTYTELPVEINCRVYESTMSASAEDNPFDQCQVHTRLFLTSPDGPQNQYEALEVLMNAFSCTLFQQFGQWHIKRLPQGAIVTSGVSKLYSWPHMVGEQVSYVWEYARYLDFEPVNASHLLTFQKPSVNSTITHNYVIPEVPRNSRLQTGDRLPSEDNTETLPIGEPPVSTTFDLVAFEIDAWEYKNVNIATMAFADAQGAFRQESRNQTTHSIRENRIFLRRDTDFVGINNKQFIRSTDDCLVDEGDKFTISGSTRLDGDISGSGSGSAVKIRIYTTVTQGFEWNGAPTNVWVAFNDATGPIGSYAYTRNFVDGDDLTEWESFSIETTTTPVPGRLVIWLQNWSIDADRYAYYKNIQIGVTIMDSPQGSELKGEKSISSNDIISRKKTTAEIKLGDSPRRVVASALWRLSPETTLTNGWGRLGETRDQRLIDINSHDLQRINSRIFKKLEGEFYGILMSQQDNALIGPGSYFYLNDGTTVKWQPVSIEIDITSNIVRLLAVEFSDLEKPTTVDETEFSYLFEDGNR